MNDRVVSTRFPYLPITLTVRDYTQDVEALLDTGFTGHPVVPATLLQAESLPDGSMLWTLADGRTIRALYYFGTVRIGGMPATEALITVLGDEPIVGRRITDEFSITLDHGRRVIVEN